MRSLSASRCAVGLGRQHLLEARPRGRHRRAGCRCRCRPGRRCRPRRRSSPPRCRRSRRTGRPPPSVLASVTMSGCTPKRSVAPPAAIARPVLTSSKISTIAVARGDLADRLEVARLGQHHAEVHHRRLHDHAGRRAPLARRGARSAAPSPAASLNGTGDRQLDRPPAGCRRRRAARRGSRGRRSPRRGRRSRPSRRRGGRGRSRRSSRSSRGRSAPRAIRIASIVASEPELTKRQRGRPKRRASSSATTIVSSVTAAKCVPERRPARAPPPTIAGWAWPCTIEPKPLWKSQ